MSKILYTPTTEQLEDLAAVDAQIGALVQQKAAYLQGVKSVLAIDKDKKVTWTKEYNLVEVPVVPKNKPE